MINIDKIVNTIVDTERALAPYDTGNLMNNGISNIESLIYGTATYWINKGGPFGPAPYGALLNEAPTIRGHVNVHYRWHDKAFRAGCQLAALELGGELI